MVTTIKVDLIQQIGESLARLAGAVHRFHFRYPIGVSKNYLILYVEQCRAAGSQLKNQRQSIEARAREIRISINTDRKCLVQEIREQGNTGKICIEQI